MTKKYDGGFSANFFSLELQIKTLLEGAGGDNAIALLDALSQLNGLEQEVALSIFTRAINRIATGESRLVTEEDRALKDFEESLYKDILDAIKEAAKTTGTTRFEVLRGGKSPRKTPINLSEARKARELRGKSIIN